MKKVLSCIFVCLLMLTMSGCGHDDDNPSSIMDDDMLEESVQESSALETNLANIYSIDEVKKQSLQDIKDTADEIATSNKKIKSEINSYQKYMNHIDRIDAYYDHVVEVVEEMGIRQREYALRYMQLYAKQNNGYDE